MKKTFLRFVTLSLLAVVSFASCKKSTDTPAITKENLAGTYTLIALTASSGGGTQDIMDAWFDDCEKDNQYKLNADLSYNYVDAGTACDPVGSFDGTWELISSSSIVIDGEQGTIKKFDGSQLIVETVGDFGGASVTFTATYSKQ